MTYHQQPASLMKSPRELGWNERGALCIHDICMATQNDSLATLLARLEGILGPVPQRLLNQGRYTHRFFTRSGALFERNSRTVHPPAIAALRGRTAEDAAPCIR